MAVNEGAACLGRATSHWMDDKAPNEFAQKLSREGWADTVFAFHDGDKIGPRMLSRLAKRTGLRPEDL